MLNRHRAFGKRQRFNVERLESRLCLDGHLGALANSLTLVADINTAPTEPTISAAAELGDDLYYILNDGNGDIELWRTDITGENNTRVIEIAANARRDTPRLDVVGDELFFSVQRVTSGSEDPDDYWYIGPAELWSSAGTAEGTRQLLTYGESHPMGSARAHVHDHDGQPFVLVDLSLHSGQFAAFLSPNESGELNRFGESFSINFQPAVEGLTQFRNDWFFVGGRVFPHSETIFSLWKTNPATGQMEMIRDFAGDEIGDNQPRNLVVVEDAIFFIADDGNSGVELWTSDGTTAGTQMVKDIFPGSEDSFPSAITPQPDGGFLFRATDETGERVWFSDGTSNGDRAAPTRRPTSAMAWCVRARDPSLRTRRSESEYRWTRS